MNSLFKICFMKLTVHICSRSVSCFSFMNINLLSSISWTWIVPGVKSEFLDKMPPTAIIHNHNISTSGVLDEEDEALLKAKKIAPITVEEPYEVKLVWSNIFRFTLLHVAAVYGFWLIFTSAQWKTNLFAFFLYQISGFGITVGAHRLWSHRSFKANLPLRIILMIFNTIAFQDSALHWCKDHRVHHKYSDTDADPHNSTRGFFFSHVGWLLWWRNNFMTFH